MSIKFIHISDTHLGFSLPSEKGGSFVFTRSRGQNLVNNMKKVFKAAKEEKVSFIIHTGDLFNRDYPPNHVLKIARTEISKIAQTIPLYFVPGNHERSRFAYNTLSKSIPGLNVFTKPKTYIQTINGKRIAISGFPFTSFIRDSFSNLLRQTNYKKVIEYSHTHILCLHQLIEDAKTGIEDYQFNTKNPHVVRRCEIPKSINYVGAGHIHRYQVLYPINEQYEKQKIIYSGSLGRINLSERNEDKGYVVGRIEDDGSVSHKFVTLPVKEFPIRDLDITNIFSPKEITRIIKKELETLSAVSLTDDSFPTLNVVGQIEKAIWNAIDIRAIKKFVPYSFVVRLKTKNLKLKDEENQ